MILKKLCPSTVISAHFPNALLTQRLGWTVQDTPPSISPCERTATASRRGFGPSSRPPPNAVLMIEACIRTPLHDAVLCLYIAAVMREILHICPTCMSIRAGSAAWGEGGCGRPGTDHPGAALQGSRLRIQVRLRGGGRADCEGIGL